MFKVKKKLYCTKIIGQGGTLLKSVSEVGFSEKKTSFGESENIGKLVQDHQNHYFGYVDKSWLVSFLLV